MRALALGAVIASASIASADHAFPYLDHVAVAEITATSTFADKHDAYAARVALDYVEKSDSMGGQPILWSAWCEGKPDEGIGEALTIKLAEPTQVGTIQIAPGVWRTKTLFDSNNHITDLEVTVDGKATKIKGGTWGEWMPVPVDRKIQTIVVKIAGVKKGKMNDSCISGIDLQREDRRLHPIIGFDPKALAALPKALSAIEAAIEDQQRKGLDALLEYPFVNQSFESAKPTKVASAAELASQCKKWFALVAKSGDMEGGDPRGCPVDGASFDASDDRPSSLVAGKPGYVTIEWQSHKDHGTTWTLHWANNRWKLTAIGWMAYGPP